MPRARRPHFEQPLSVAQRVHMLLTANLNLFFYRARTDARVTGAGVLHRANFAPMGGAAKIVEVDQTVKNPGHHINLA
jgi:hypothetical protein